MDMHKEFELYVFKYKTTQEVNKYVCSEHTH